MNVFTLGANFYKNTLYHFVTCYVTLDTNYDLHLCDILRGDVIIIIIQHFNRGMCQTSGGCSLC